MNPNGAIYNITDSVIASSSHKQTPQIFGGASVNYRPIDRLNIFANLYAVADQSFSFGHIVASDLSYLEITEEISSYAVINLKASYRILDNRTKADIYLSARNLLNSNNREFGFADRTAGLYTAGVSVSF